jgi:nucleotide-binding universal stress UspA family protein
MQPAFRVRRLDLYRQFDRLLREPMEEYLAGVVRRLARAASVGVASTLVDAREVNAALSELVASTNDIMVMATRGRTVFGRALAGNRLDAILQRRQAPILCVRGYSCPVDLTARPSLRHALVPLDGSSKSADILRPLTTLSKLTGGRQTLLRVVQSAGAAACGHGSSGPKAGDGKDSPHTCLEKLANAWRHELPLVRTSVVWSDDSPARAMLAEAEAKEVDFIASATRPHSRLSRLLRPGIFDRLIQRATVPILVVKRTDQGIGSATEVEPACDAGTC